MGERTQSRKLLQHDRRDEYRKSKTADENILQEPEHFMKAGPEATPKNRIDYSEEPAGRQQWQCIV